MKTTTCDRPIEAASIEIRGNTYPVKDQLRSLGCRWNPAGKCWMATPAIADAARKIVGVTPVYNSPPPPDLGPVDVVAEAAKYHRTPIDGAKATPFRRGSSKGENHLGETFWGKSHGVRNRYLVVRQARPNYLSRDWLEDMDMFSTKPGWYCSVEAIAVVPTADEIANDPAVAKAKAEARKKRQYEIERAVQQSPQPKDARLQSHSTSGLTKCWGKSRMSGHELLWSDGVSRLVYETGHYDDGPASWELIDAALAAEALTLKEAV